MAAIPGGNAVDVELRHLRAFEVLLRERKLTRTATLLGVAQPALSKTLAKLRRYFADPLFVRADTAWSPRPRRSRSPRPSARCLTTRRCCARHLPFDPQSSRRTFTFSVVDSGLVRLLPRLLTYLEARAPAAGCT
jgi:DNA-binding transcriptional LysR family regulator